MSVYTPVTAADLRSLLGDYAIGELEDFRGISAGVTNTNYFVDTTLGRWVLTLFEQTEDHSALPFFMQLMDHLAAHGVPGAHPVARDDGGFLSRVRGRPAALVYRLSGASVEAPGAHHCHSLGGVVAEMHRAVAGFEVQHPNPRGLTWIANARQRLAAELPAQALTLLDDEIDVQQAAVHDEYAPLSQAIVHADLFRDNVLFEAGRVSGVIDFYYACHEYLLFDLAVICNDWAFDNGCFRSERWSAFIERYQRRHPLSERDSRAWPKMLRAAALRFWVSRLVDYHFPPSGEVTHVHDPWPFENLLRLHRSAPPALSPGHNP